MEATLKTIHRDMEKIKDEQLFLRHVLEEEYEPTKDARQKLQAAREHMGREPQTRFSVFKTL